MMPECVVTRRTDRPVSATLRIDDICRLVGLPDTDSWMREWALDHAGEAYEAALSEALETTGDVPTVVERAQAAEEAAERAALVAQGSEAREAFRRVTRRLKLQAVWLDAPGKARECQVRPRNGWEACADAMRSVLNESDRIPFHFPTLEAFLASGPYTARDAVLRYLHWLIDCGPSFGMVRW